MYTYVPQPTAILKVHITHGIRQIQQDLFNRHGKLNILVACHQEQPGYIFQCYYIPHVLYFTQIKKSRLYFIHTLFYLTLKIRKT